MRRGMWAVAIASLLGVSMPAKADLVSFQGLQLDFAATTTNPGDPNVLNVNIQNILIIGGSDNLTTTVTGSIFFDGTFDTATSQFTEISFNAATFGNAADVTRTLLLVIPGTTATITLTDAGFNIGALDNGSIINGPFIPVTNPPGEFNLGGNTLQINQGSLDYVVQGGISLGPDSVNFETDPVDATIDPAENLLGFLTAVQSGPETWDVTFSSPLFLQTFIELLSPDDTLLTITLNVIATGELNVIPEPSSFALMGLVGVLGGGSVWYRRRQRAAKSVA